MDDGCSYDHVCRVYEDSAAFRMTITAVRAYVHAFRRLPSLSEAGLFRTLLDVTGTSMGICGAEVSPA